MPSNIHLTEPANIVHAPNRLEDSHPAPEKLIAFLDLYCNGMDPREAWVQAGYSPNTKHLAKAKIRENWKLLEKMIDERIGTHVPLALNIIVDIMINAKSDQTRLLAAKDILSRAGKDKPIQIVTEKKAADQMNDLEIDEEIRALSHKLVKEAK